MLCQRQVGIGKQTPEQAKQMLGLGYRVLVFGFDWMLLQQAAARFLEEVRSK